MKPKILGSRIAHTNPWYSVREDTLEWPNGKPGKYFVCEVTPCAAIIAIRDACILTVTQYRYPSDSVSLEIPIGGMHENEIPIDAAKRELLEETGCVAASLTQIATYHSLNGLARAKGYVFFAEGVTDTHIQHLDDSEAGLRTEWMPLATWRNHIRTGTIVDAESLAVWAIYLEHTRL